MQWLCMQCLFAHGWEVVHCGARRSLVPFLLKRRWWPQPQLCLAGSEVCEFCDAEVAVKDEKVKKTKSLLDENLWVTWCLVRRVSLVRWKTQGFPETLKLLSRIQAIALEQSETRSSSLLQHPRFAKLRRAIMRPAASWLHDTVNSSKHSMRKIT